MPFAKLLPAVALFALLAALAGCGGSKPSEPTPTPQPLPQPAPAGGGPAYELDPAKHAIPAAPATGQIGGATFTPDRVELEGERLTFRTGKDFFADQEISLSLSRSANLAEGLKVTVKPDEAWGGVTPMVRVSVRKSKEGLPDTAFADKYALTLELGKPEKGRTPGKIYLCFPDAGKGVLAGTFTAERKRSLQEPPGDEEVPFVQGAVTPPLQKDQWMNGGYVGLTADGKLISDGAGTKVFEDGSGAVRSTTFVPRTAGVRIEKFATHYDFTNLPPGRYLVFAHGGAGGAAWAWVDVAAGAKVTKDLAIDASKNGTVEVTLPATEHDVRVVPTDLGTPAPDDAFLTQLSYSLDLKAEPKDGKATLANIPAGKYQVRAGLLKADVEVMAGKTAKVELKDEKK